MPVTDHRTPASLQLRLLAAACLTNVAMGVLYVWSLFLMPIEAALAQPRSVLSLVPTLALVSFTLGMFLHDRLLRWLGFRAFALLAFGLAGAGHLVFALSGSLAGLMLGYGIIFGFGAGFGYGLALALVIQLPENRRSLAIGLVMAAFAVSGIALSSLLAEPIRVTPPDRSFLMIGGAVLAFGLVVAALMPRKVSAVAGQSAAGSPLRQDFTEARFLTIFLVFFSICFSGLLVVSHSSGIVAAQGAGDRLTGLTPGAFTLGYVLGSFFAGRLVEAWSGRIMLLVFNILGGIGLALFLLPASPLALLAAAAIGVVFGGSASLMPVLIGEQYGASRIGEIYGKLMLAYGAGGLIAPVLSGKIYSATGGYTWSIGLALALCAAGLVLGLTLRRPVPGLAAH